MATRATTNPMADALGGGMGRRRKAGESAGGSVSRRRTVPRAGERRVAVDVPTDLYTQAKILAVQLDMTVKEVMVAGLRAEVDRLGGRAG